MGHIAQSTPLQQACLSSMGTRMVQIGFDQISAVLALQAKRIERDGAAAKHVCEAWMRACACDAGAVAQAWQTMTREYFAASVALWEQGLVSAASNRAAYGALLRDMVINAENAWSQATPAEVTRPAGGMPQAADWTTYLGPFMGTLPDGEAKPAGAAQRPATSARA